MKSAQEHGLENKDAIHTDSKRINTAKECWEHLSKLFTSSNWSEDHANKKVGQYIALWRDQKEMDRGALSSMRVARASMQPARS